MTLSTAPVALEQGRGRARHERLVRLRGPGAVAAGIVGAVAVLAVLDPNEPGHYPVCPVRSVSGLDCPGCGGLRCVHALATGKPWEAADQNLLAAMVIPVLVLAWVAWTRRAWLGLPRPAPTRAAIVWTFGIAVAVFTVLRNIPGVPFLGSGLG